MSSVYQGDPAFKITEDGSILKFVGGQPIMDQGFENTVLISLFTKRNWPGNVLARKDSEKIGSDFEDSHNQPVNLKGLNARRDAARKALQWAIDQGIFRDVVVNVTNPKGSIIIVNIRITPPYGENVDLNIENSGPNWKFQKDNPAHRRF